jgi:hypothetical protein
MPKLKGSQAVYFESSSVEATFPNGGQVDYKTEDIKATKSPSGDDMIVFQHGSDSSIAHRVRLYLTPPERDWRKNVTYRWELSSAWMSVPGTQNAAGNETDWWYWNIENNINSQIKVWSPKALFSCESITLHFSEINPMPWKKKKKKNGAIKGGDEASSSVAKIVMKNVLLGAHMDAKTAGGGAVGRYRPCQSNVCDMVDGVVTSESMFGVTVPTVLPPGVPVYVVVLVIAVPILVILFSMYRCCQRRMLTHRYDPIVNDGKNDLELDEEET